MTTNLIYNDTFKFLKSAEGSSTMFIDNLENIGIGTDDPSHKFHTNKSIRCDGDLIMNPVKLNNDNLTGTSATLIINANTTELTDHLTMEDNKKIIFRDSNTYINRASPSNNESNNELNINAVTTKLTGDLKLNPGNKLILNNGNTYINSESSGNITFNGHLTINGEVTINKDQLDLDWDDLLISNTINIEDKNIELNYIDSPNNANANGGGIILKASSDKKITYEGTDSNDNWKSNIDFKVGSNITLGTNGTITGTAFKPGNFNISGSTISLSSGGTITFAKNITNIGTLDGYWNSTTNNISINGTVFSHIFPGMIIPWYSNQPNAPTGWSFCSDLNEKFPYGADSTQNVGQTGGKATVTLGIGEIPEHTHTIGAGGSNHSHTWWDNYAGTTNYQFYWSNSEDWQDGAHYELSGYGHNFRDIYSNMQIDRQTSRGDHGHDIDTQDGEANEGGQGAHENMPPYYKIRYIKKD